MRMSHDGGIVLWVSTLILIDKSVIGVVMLATTSIIES